MSSAAMAFGLMFVSVSPADAYAAAVSEEIPQDVAQEINAVALDG